MRNIPKNKWSKAHHWLIQQWQKGALPETQGAVSVFLLSIVTIITIRAQEKKRRNQTIVNKQVYERGSGNGYTTGITKTS